MTPQIACSAVDVNVFHEWGRTSARGKVTFPAQSITSFEKTTFFEAKCYFPDKKCHFFDSSGTFFSKKYRLEEKNITWAEKNITWTQKISFGRKKRHLGEKHGAWPGIGKCPR
ncbi:hypothetical protein [Citrifermentans bremense]|uniref:hypothetical protein n=1 Tax=Citrifermentans bremense TaxID=60035 RepID=UPI0012ECA858|nr:hypothetical protein [Citrifermentans bremense]